jgi:hypothetical protein
MYHPVMSGNSLKGIAPPDDAVNGTMRKRYCPVFLVSGDIGPYLKEKVKSYRISHALSCPPSPGKGLRSGTRASAWGHTVSMRPTGKHGWDVIRHLAKAPSLQKGAQNPLIRVLLPEPLHVTVASPAGIRRNGLLSAFQGFLFTGI